MSTYAKADRKSQWYGDKYGSATFKPNCVVVHSTETYGWPGYSGGSMAPNLTALPDIANKKVLFRAHFEDEESSRALVNLSGGVETNTSGAIQIELVGTCNPAWAKTWPGTSKVGGRDYLYLPEAPDWYLEQLADFAWDLNRRHGIKLQTVPTWLNYGPDKRRKDGKSPASYGDNGVRMSFAQWRAFYGWCGHQHVPENDHGDPGAFPMQRVLDLAAGSTLSKPVTTLPLPTIPAPLPKPAAPEEDDMPTADQIARAILGYKNKAVNGDRDLYQVITDGSLYRDHVPAPNKADTNNPTWQTFSYLRETFLLLQRVEASNRGLEAAVKALAASHGANGDAVVDAVRGEVAKAMQGLEITLSTPGSD